MSVAHGATPPAWTEWPEAIRLFVRGATVRPASGIALVVGTLVSAVNQGDVLAAGAAGPGTWARCVVNYCVPFCVASLSYLKGSLRRRIPPGDEHPARSDRPAGTGIDGVRSSSWPARSDVLSIRRQVCDNPAPCPERSVIKLVFVIHAKDGWTRAAAADHWLHTHAPIVRTLPHLVSYVQKQAVRGLDGAPQFLGIGELWFRSTEEAEQALRSPEMDDVRADGAIFTQQDRAWRVWVEEYELPGTSATPS